MPALYLYELRKMIKPGSYPSYIYFSFNAEEHRIEFEPAGLRYKGENGKTRFNNALTLLGKEKTYTVLLVPEPNNPYDKYAVKIYCSVDGEKIDLGYVPKRPLFVPYNPPYFNYWLYKSQKYFKNPTIKYNEEQKTFVITFELKEAWKPATLEYPSSESDPVENLMSMGFGCLSVWSGIMVAIICFVVIINLKIPSVIRFAAAMILLSLSGFIAEFFE